MRAVNKNVLLFLGGESPESFVISFDYDAIYAVDLGVELCVKWQLEPQLILGDFDSYALCDAKSHFPHVEYKVFEKDKDFTDTELAIMEAERHSYDDITLVGGFGGRVDHFLHIYELFKKYDAVSRWVGPKYQIQRVREKVKLDTAYISDKYISFIPIYSNIPTIQKSKGLTWSLDTINITQDLSSISNEYTERYVEVEMQKGELFMIWAHHNRAQYCIS